MIADGFAPDKNVCEMLWFFTFQCLSPTSKYSLATFENAHYSNRFAEICLHRRVNDLLSLFSLAKKLDFRYNFSLEV